MNDKLYITSRSKPPLQIKTDEKPKILHLGCCNEPLPPTLFKHIFPNGIEEIRVDIDPHCKCDIIADIRKLPLDDQSVSGIFASHVLEHFDRTERVDLLTEWKRVTKHSGVIYVVVPRLDSIRVIEALQEGDPDKVIYKSPAGDITAAQLIYGQFYTGPYEQHKWGYTKKTLVGFLQNYLIDIVVGEQEHQICCYGWVCR